MNNLLEDDLQTIKYYLGNNLISSDNFSQICKIANLLPNFPTISDTIFECHLGLSTPRTDFSVSFTTLNQGRKTLVDISKTLKNLLSTNFSWQKVYSFSTQWANSKSFLYDNVENIWLEFDLNSKLLEVPEPSLFFGPKDFRQNKNNLSSYNENNIISKSKWIADEALKLLFNSFLRQEMKQQLLLCFQSLPSDAEVFQIGVMLPRKSESKAIRLCVEDINIDQILEYLVNIGWSDSSNKLGCLLSELSELVDIIKLNFAIEDKIIYPKIGLECYLHKQPRNSPKWKLFRDYLIKNKLCTLDQANVIFNWSGYSENKDNFKLAQDKFEKRYADVSLDSKNVSGRLLSHIKLVYQTNQPLQAKAYLWFGHRWLAQNGSFQKSVLKTH